MDKINIETPPIHSKINLTREWEFFKQKLKNRTDKKFKKKTIKYVNKLIKIAKIYDAYELSFRIYIENETSRREKIK